MRRIRYSIKNHSLKAYWGSERIIPPILNFGTLWK